MTKQELKEALRIVYDMEKSLFLMRNLRERIKSILRNSSFKKSVIPPRQPQKPEKREAYYDFSKYLKGSIGITAVLCGVLGMLTQCSSSGKNYEDSIFGSIGRVEDSIGNSIVGGIVGILIGVALGAIIGVIVTYVAKNEQDREYAEWYVKEKEQYERDIEIYEQEQEKYLRNLKNENQQLALFEAKTRALRNEENKLANQYRITQANRDKFYDWIGIDDRFRNIVPIGYMYEFIKLGISTKLEGTDGLYYLILQELRYDQMQYTLDEISSKMDTLINKQREIYSELKELNYRTERMADSLLRLVDSVNSQSNLLEEIRKNSVVNNYTNERIACELEYQTYLKKITSIL